MDEDQKALLTPLPRPVDAVESRITRNCTRSMY